MLSVTNSVQTLDFKFKSIAINLESSFFLNMFKLNKKSIFNFYVKNMNLKIINMDYNNFTIAMGPMFVDIVVLETSKVILSIMNCVK